MKFFYIINKIKTAPHQQEMDLDNVHKMIIIFDLFSLAKQRKLKC